MHEQVREQHHKDVGAVGLLRERVEAQDKGARGKEHPLAARHLLAPRLDLPLVPRGVLVRRPLAALEERHVAVPRRAPAHGLALVDLAPELGRELVCAPRAAERPRARELAIGVDNVVELRAVCAVERVEPADGRGALKHGLPERHVWLVHGRRRPQARRWLKRDGRRRPCPLRRPLPLPLPLYQCLCLCWDEKVGRPHELLIRQLCPETGGGSSRARTLMR